jgi:hypothetical protein
LFEGAGAAAAAREHFAEQGLTARTDTVVGDFFDAWPAGGTVYILCQVLHDWPDADAARILRRARAALDGGGRLLIVDRVVDAAHPTPSHIHMNLLMHNLFGSRERTAEQFTALATAAGLRTVQVRATGHELSMVEMVVADDSQPTGRDAGRRQVA